MTMLQKKNLQTIMSQQSNTPEQTYSQGKELFAERYNRIKSMKKKNQLSPRLGSQYPRNKENLNHNYQYKAQLQQMERKSSKSKPKLQEIHVNTGHERCENETKIKGLLSNKAKQNFTVKNNVDNILCEGYSKDGHYRIVSKILQGEELKKAVQWEHRENFKSKHEKNQPKTPKSKLQLEPSKTSNRENGIIRGYAVNTNEGIVRSYNEDRVSIILNITKNGQKAFYFAIYDGHGGNNCCDFLSTHLHQYILNSKKFPSEPRQAIVEGIKMAEVEFMTKVKRDYLNSYDCDKSGSCILLTLIVGDECYIANVGDSRAVLSTENGKLLYSLSRDHKPTDSKEQERIMKEGGKIYRTEIKKKESKNKKQEEPVIGPLRVFPGKLSVTRTIGDIEAKDKDFGGIPNCIITDPEICKYKLTGKEDFIVLGCDGIFEKLDSEEVVEEAWKGINKTNTNIHDACGNAVHTILKTSMQRKSSDNVTAILICFGGLGFGTMDEYKSV